jgi:hypothetical protein
MTLIKITPHGWGWKALEAPGVESVFPTEDDAISYAQTARVLPCRRNSRLEPDQNFCRNENESLVFLRVAMTVLVLVVVRTGPSSPFKPLEQRCYVGGELSTTPQMIPWQLRRLLLRSRSPDSLRSTWLPCGANVGETAAYQRSRRIRF